MLRREGLHCSMSTSFSRGRAIVQGASGDRKVTFSEDGEMLLEQDVLGVWQSPAGKWLAGVAGVSGRK
jgi:hypothetical protein